MVTAAAVERVSQRLKDVRESILDNDGDPIFQSDFARMLQRQGERMFGKALEHKYSPSLVNRLENAIQPPSLQDIAVYAVLDPLHRGKLWLAWNERDDSALERQPIPGVKDIPVDVMQDRLPPTATPKRRQGGR